MACVDAKEYAKDVVREIVSDLVDYCFETLEVPPDSPDKLPDYIYSQLARNFSEYDNYSEYTIQEVEYIFLEYSGEYPECDYPMQVKDLQSYQHAGKVLARVMMKNAAMAEIHQIFRSLHCIDLDFFAETDEDGEPIEECDREQYVRELLESEINVILA